MKTAAEIILPGDLIAWNILDKLTTILIIFSIAWLLIRIVRVIKLNFLKRYDISVQDNLQSRKVHTNYPSLPKTRIHLQDQSGETFKTSFDTAGS
ncbi:MAG: hypothetical protein U5R06_05910 [candidate division KSB1 bacterium]|nr:hypothetical protein [candidate division KSB1 bacterium]